MTERSHGEKVLCSPLSNKKKYQDEKAKTAKEHEELEEGRAPYVKAMLAARPKRVFAKRCS